MALTEANSSQQLEFSRPLAKFSPSAWGDHFISFSTPNSKWEVYSEEIKVFKEEVREMLNMASTSNSTVEKMNLINLLERLGVSYHFESEIEEQLQHILDALPASFDDNDNDYDLYTVALQFRIFRQHGYNISSDMFEKFKDSNGKFKETLTKDIKGMLSLYEASQLRIHGEDILDEALAFSTTHLESMATQISSPLLAKQVIHALNYLPYHKSIPRIESRHYISIYQEDESRNESLLKFAQLDFNLLQSLHQQELSHLFKWWKELDLASKLSYARDRLMECYCGIAGMLFEPQYSLARLIATKLTLVLSVVDDTYDAYGTFEELQVFTDAVQRWEAGAIDQLPDYMKVIHGAILNLYNELEEEMAKKGMSYCIHHAKEAMKEMVRSYYVEVNWLYEGYVPTFDEFMDNGLITSSSQFLIAASFVAMEEIVTEKAFDWLQTKPKIVRASQKIARLMNDIRSHEAEQERGHVASSVECYMKQYNLSEEEITEEFLRMVSEAWKDINEECLRPIAISMHFLMRVVNFTRVTEVVYKYDDGYTNPESFVNDYITSLFIDHIPIQE